MSAHYDAQYQKKIIIIIIDSQYDYIFDNYNAFHTHTKTHTSASIFGNLFYHLYSCTFFHKMFKNMFTIQELQTKQNGQVI